MKYLRLFESESPEDRFLDITREPVNLIWDVIESYEDDGKITDVDISVTSISTTNIPIICCLFKSSTDYHFEKTGLKLFESGRPLEYSIGLSVDFRSLANMYGEMMERLSSMYEINYSHIHYLDNRGRRSFLSPENWKNIDPSKDIITVDDIINLREKNKWLFIETSVDIRISLDK